MRTSRPTLRQLAPLAAVLCFCPVRAGAAGLYSTNPAFYLESSFAGSGPASEDGFARALGTGDFDCDGVGDLATGLRTEGSSVSVGPLHVRYGSPGIGLGAAVRVDPPDQVVTLARGDFDGDDCDDLAVASPGVGAYVRIYYGSPAGLAATPTQRFDTGTPGIGGSTGPLGGTPSTFSLEFGAALTAADLDADGFEDLVIGHPDYDSDFDSNAGRIVVLYGTPTGLSTSRLGKLTQDHPGMDGTDETNDRFGAALASGDFDGDGYADVVVGVPGENDGGGFQVLLGGPTGLTEVGNELWTQGDEGVPDEDEAGDNLGYALAAADLDGDGFDDVAVAAPYEDLELAGGGAVTDAGAVHVYFGSPAGITTDQAFSVTSTDTGLGDSEGSDVWGQALAAGDFDLDGFADLAIAAPGEYLEGLAAVGEVTILRGSSNGPTKLGGRNLQQNKPGVPDGNEQGDLFGRALAVGDFDGNLFPDLAIGGPGESTGPFVHNGAEWILHGYLFADGLELGSTAAWEGRTANPRNANNVFAYPVTWLGPVESQQALRVNLLDPASVLSRPAWVMAGPALGFASENRLTGSFFIDPQGLTMSSSPGVNAFQMMAFNDGVGAGSRTRLIFSLNRAAGGWFLNVSHWNDGLGPGGDFQFSGGAFLALANNPAWRNNRVEFEWTAGNPGRLIMWRTRHVGGVPDASGRIQMLAVDLPGMQSAVVNHVFAGMFAGQDPGTSGALYLDELSFGR